MLKKIIVCLISLLLILNSTLTNAFAIRQWNVSNPMAVGASILYDGLKGALTSSILITPNATQVAKVLAGGGAGFALSYAVEQLLGAVDWVLDPANNQIRYKPVDCTNSPTCMPNYPYVIRFDGKYYPDGKQQVLCQNWLNTHPYFSTRPKTDPPITVIAQSSYCKIYGGKEGFNGNIGSTYQRIKNTAYDPNKLEKTLPLETVAQKVIENAESDNLDAQFAVLAAANNILSEAEQDDAKAKPIEDELENNAKCPSGIVRNGSCWICDKSQFMPITRATRDAKTAARGKSCEYVTDPVIKATNAVFWRNLINARIQENACWSPVDPNHLIELNNNRNALSKCEN